MDYFSLLDLTTQFDLDLKALEQAYFTQQRLYHPDRFVGKPDADRQRAVQRSADLNNAYQTLKAPLTRAQYLLQLQGIAVGTEADSVKPSQALLVEIMEWREQASEAEDIAILNKLTATLDEMRELTIRHIDKAYSSKNWEAMAQEVLQLGYLIKVQEDVVLQKNRLKHESAANT